MPPLSIGIILSEGKIDTINRLQCPTPPIQAKSWRKWDSAGFFRIFSYLLRNYSLISVSNQRRGAFPHRFLFTENFAYLSATIEPNISRLSVMLFSFPTTQKQF